MTSDNEAYWNWYGEFVDEDVESARNIGKAKYDGTAVVLPADDPLIVEWNQWERLYG